MKGKCFCKYTRCVEISVSFRSNFIPVGFLSCRNKSFAQKVPNIFVVSVPNFV